MKPQTLNSQIHFRHFLRTVCLVAAIAVLCSYGRAETDSPLADSHQLILVITESDSAAQGEMLRFARNENNAWQAVDEAIIPVTVGKRGLGWGSGLHSETSVGLIKKREGDGKSPAGIFRLSAIFGFADPAGMKQLKMPYFHVTAVSECVDDGNSQYYNTVLQRSDVPEPDWNSSEKMLKVGPQYALGVLVDHNTSATPGDGSCIFLHIWGYRGDPTIGCTAMSPSAMKEVAEWLDEKQRPVLVQLTRTLYDVFKETWQLPDED